MHLFRAVLQFPADEYDTLVFYLTNRSTCLSDLARDDGISEQAAKKRFNTALALDYASGAFISTSNPFLKAFQRQLEQLQEALYSHDALAGLRELCTGANPRGSLLSRAWMFLESRAVNAVVAGFNGNGPNSLDAVTGRHGHRVAVLGGDGMHITQVMHDGELVEVCDSPATADAVSSAAKRLAVAAFADAPDGSLDELMFVFKEADPTLYDESGRAMCVVDLRERGGDGPPGCTIEEELEGCENLPVRALFNLLACRVCKAPLLPPLGAEAPLRRARRSLPLRAGRRAILRREPHPRPGARCDV